MKPPLFVRPLTAQEKQALQAGLRSSQVFTVRRCQVLLASADKHRPKQIAQVVGCSDQAVRNAIKAFAQEGLSALKAKSNRPKTVKPMLDEAKREKLKSLLHRGPRSYAKSRSLWTLELVTEVCFEQGLTPHLVSDETIRNALHRLKLNWKRAKHWISSPDPAYQAKKNAAID